MKPQNQFSVHRLPTFGLVLVGLWCCCFPQQSWAQNWSPHPTNGGFPTNLATRANFQLQDIPCENCDTPSSSLPPLPGIEAYEDPQMYAAVEGNSLDPNGIYDQEGMYDQAGVYSDSHGEYYPSGEWFPNRPHLIPRTIDRFQQRPLFPNRPYLRGAWPGGPPLERPRTFWLNPFGLQQGVGNFLFRGNHPADTGSLGLPFSLVPSHVADRVPRPYFGHGQNYIQSPHIGMGQPLVGTSWGNRPYSLEVFTGAFLANQLNENVKQGNGLMSGLRVGWDFDHYWGTEFRMGFGNTRVDGSSSKVDVRLADIGVIYYPWGDARWRPYTSVGLGIGNFAFQDGTQSVDDYALQIPLSIGVKYAFKPWWSLRLDATDFLSMPSSHLDFMNNVQLTGAVEYRFGGRRRSYFPYNPSIQLK